MLKDKEAFAANKDRTVEINDLERSKSEISELYSKEKSRSTAHA